MFGVPLDTSGLSWVRWQNGVEGLLCTGAAHVQGPRNRLIGSEGIIEVGGAERAPLRLLRAGAAWQDFADEEIADVVPPSDDTVLSVLDVIDCLESGEEPRLSARKALQATELIFATYESSRRRGRVVLPLDVEDSALITMLKEGANRAGLVVPVPDGRGRKANLEAIDALLSADDFVRVWDQCGGGPRCGSTSTRA